MKCADPTLCYTDHSGKKLYRSWSLATNTLKKIAQQVFNCGKCIFCRKKNSYSLAMRCVLHASLYQKNCFLTLTYDEKNPNYHNNFEYSDIQKFKKRLRQHVSRNFNGKKIEIFNVHEYGKNGKKHWHLIVFNHDFDDKTIHTMKNGLPLYTSLTLNSLWPYGFNTIADVSEGSAMYQSQYTQKDIKNGNSHNSKKSHSKHSGIGKPYFLLHYSQILRLGYIPFNGQKFPIPRSFEKIAHKHYSHFYDPDNFHDFPHRKALYRPFKPGLENKELADLFVQYKEQKSQKISEMEAQWTEMLIKYFDTKEVPDFIKSAENYLYDFNNKLTQEKF